MKDFEDAIRAVGMEPRKIIPGKMCRFPGIGKKRGESGWALLFEDQKAGVFGDWATGFQDKWRSGKRSEVDRDEIRRMQEKREREKVIARKAARERAVKICQEALPQCPHPYAERKRLSTWLVNERRVVVPLRGWGRIVNVQLIDQYGQKRFLPGGVVQGAHAFVPGVTFLEDHTGPVIICEGYATGSSLRKLFPEAYIACAMSCSNLIHVARLLKGVGSKLIIAGDDDRFTPGNPGRTHATQCAKEMGCEVIFPSFPEGCDGTDFNDVECFDGLV